MYNAHLIYGKAQLPGNPTTHNAMSVLMREDHHHIQMEDVSEFPLQRSLDCQDWETVNQQEFDEMLDALSEDRVKVFLGVLRSGSFPRHEGYYYRICPHDKNYT